MSDEIGDSLTYTKLDAGLDKLDALLDKLSALNERLDRLELLVGTVAANQVNQSINLAPPTPPFAERVRKAVEAGMKAFAVPAQPEVAHFTPEPASSFHGQQP